MDGGVVEDHHWWPEAWRAQCALSAPSPEHSNHPERYAPGAPVLECKKPRKVRCSRGDDLEDGRLLDVFSAAGCQLFDF